MKCGNCDDEINGTKRHITSPAGRFCSPECEEKTSKELAKKAIKRLNDELLSDVITIQEHRDRRRTMMGR